MLRRASKQKSSLHQAHRLRWCAFRNVRLGILVTKHDTSSARGKTHTKITHVTWRIVTRRHDCPTYHSFELCERWLSGCSSAEQCVRDRCTNHELDTIRFATYCKFFEKTLEPTVTNLRFSSSSWGALQLVYRSWLRHHWWRMTSAIHLLSVSV